MKSNDSLLSSVSYATILSISNRKCDSGFSETTSSIQISTCFEQILVVERTYHENLKQYIIKYSRPLRRYLHPNEIVDLFQNIEKISAISQSIVRHCEKLFDEDNTFNIPISIIYQSCLDVMIDSYNTYISRSIEVQAILKQYCHKIAYFLQIPIELVIQEITEFILLPIRYICILNDLFQLFVIDYTDLMNDIDWNIIQNIRYLSKQANNILHLLCYNEISILESSQDTTLQSDISSIIVLQRINKEPWESKQIELLDSKLVFTKMNQISSICLSNVVHIEEDSLNTKLCLIVASTYSRYSSITMIRVYIRFQDKNDYFIWLKHLTNAIKKAKDQNWTENNELVI
ncbi:unnamed protein product [Rotaria sordida]|nr:unnamed protein product [Rotaria sordida]CAF1050813.1 unnamed protein product [Rotaria sordida]CAF1164021.1 unnamed protein product [Rotaria sordida]CAF1190675.1 unnamed protein product [Rotaria sordida]CAF1307673.1 unnamed protein product [Rotaria sordida]